MPQGKGTYGSQVGRPRKKYNTGGPEPAPELIESFENIPTIEERKNNMLDDVMLSVRRRRELIELGMPEDEAQESLDTIVRNAKGFGVTRSDVLGLDAQVVQELQEAALEPLKIQKQVEALQGNTDRVPYSRGGISKLAEKLSRKLRSKFKGDAAIESDISYLSSKIEDVDNELGGIGSKNIDFEKEVIAELQGEKADYMRGLKLIEEEGVPLNYDEAGFPITKKEAKQLERRLEQKSPEYQEREAKTLAQIEREAEEALSMPERPTKPDSIIPEGSREFDREFDIMKDQKRSIIKAENKARTAKLIEARRLTKSERKLLQEELPKRLPAVYTAEQAETHIGATTPDKIIKDYEAGEEVIIYFGDPPDTLPDLAFNASMIDEILGKTDKIDEIWGKGRTKKAVGGELVAIDETYSDIKSLLSKKQDKAIQNIIAQKRIKDYSVLGRGMNMADKATSLAVRGNTDIVIEDFDEKEMYIALGQKMLDSEKRTKKQEGGELDDQMSMLMEEEETHTMPDGTVMPGATHEEYEQMLPDEEMEEDYVEYVFDSTLNPQDKEYLENALAEDAKLSEIIDIVVESTTEFSGSGLLEGPGTGKSDSIPARLSDGEFVMTAKATEEIGSDNLMSMMKEAEAAADTRQKVAYGGYMTEMENETVPIQTLGVREARRNIPQVAQTQRQVEEEMLKASPRRFYQPISG